MFRTEDQRLMRATATAMGLNLLAWFVVDLGGRELAVDGRDPSAPTSVPLGAVLLATAAGGVAALVLVRLAARTARPPLAFAVAAAVGLALSCVPPVQAATTTSTALALVAMHLIAAAVIVPPAARLVRASQPAAPSRPTAIS